MSRWEVFAGLVLAFCGGVVVGSVGRLLPERDYVVYVETPGHDKLYRVGHSWTPDVGDSARYSQRKAYRLCPPTVGAPICHVARVEECVRE